MTRLIDADELTMAVFKKAIDDVFMGGNTDMHKLLISIVAHQPTIDAMPVRHGRWLYSCVYGKVEWVCNQCEQDANTKTKYCPHCGARMDEE